jgi:hypothetical protein
MRNYLIPLRVQVPTESRDDKQDANRPKRFHKPPSKIFLER